MSKVHEVMNRSFISVPPTMLITEAARKMRDSSDEVIVVCENGRYKGLVTREDIVSFIVSNSNDLARKSVASVMNNGLPKISAGVDILEAAKVMARKDIQHMPVVQNGKFLGLLTIDDLLYESPALAVIVLTKHCEMKGRRERELAQVN